MLDRETYVKLVRDLTSRDPQKVRDANRRMYGSVVNGVEPGGLASGESVRYTGDRNHNREADLVLAEIANG